MSVLAGITVNYFKGVSSGLTFKWVLNVWELYADSIFLSLWLAIACLIVTLIIGLPAAYGLARHPGWLSRLLEEFISLPLAVPGLALALALLQLYGTLSGLHFLDIYTSRPCPLYFAIYGTINPSSSRSNGS